MGLIEKWTFDFTKKFDFGGGIINFAFYTPVPAIEINTGHFKNPNYKKVEKHSNYYFYWDDRLKGDNQKAYKFQNLDLEFNSKGNYCPNCKTFQLELISMAIFDWLKCVKLKKSLKPPL